VTQFDCGTGSSYWWACDLEWSSYSSYLTDIYYFTESTLWATDFTATTTTLCDGYARIIGDLTPTASSLTVYGMPGTTSYTGSPPSCTVPQSACSSMQRQMAVSSSSYDSALTAWQAANSTGVEPEWPSTLPDSVQCTVTGAAATESYCGQCKIYGGTVKVSLPFPLQ
jgi:hypothetical protein